MTGDLGESLANVFLSRRTAEGNLFRTTLIGGKWPTIDIYAEVITSNETLKFCFFQIKTTDQGYTKKERKLKIQVDKFDLNKLSSYNAPTYLIGIDHNDNEPFKSKAYIATIRGSYENPLSSLPTTYELTEQRLIQLKNEVVDYWNNANTIVIKSDYNSNFAI